MNLDKLSNDIESEVHAIHDISRETHESILSVVENNKINDEIIDANEFETYMIENLRPFSKKILQYIRVRLQDINKDLINHIINVILIKANRIFPNNTDIYLMYCLKELDNNKDKFIRKCLSDITKKMESTEQYYLRIFFYFATFIAIVGSICFINKLRNVYEIKRKNKIIS